MSTQQQGAAGRDVERAPHVVRAGAATSGQDGSAGRIGAVVVDYGAGDLLVACVRSLADAGVSRTIVVDNGTADGVVPSSAEALDAAGVRDRGVEVLCTTRNRGYGAGANVGWRRFGQEVDCVLVCNADVRVDPAGLPVLAAALAAEPACGIVGPRIVETDGTTYPSARAFPSALDAAGHALFGRLWHGNPFSRRYLGGAADPGADGTGGVRAGSGLVRRTDWVSGACLLARRETLEAIGGFDERYFMYLEDVDLCRRAARAGWCTGWVEKVTVHHARHALSTQHPYRMVLAHHVSALRYEARSASGLRLACWPLAAVLLSVRAAVEIAILALRGARRVGARAGSRAGSGPPARRD